MILADAGDAIALIDGASGARVSYRALAAQVAEAADRLHGAAAGGLAFVFARNDVASVVAYLGALAAGVPVVLCDPQLPDDKAAALIERYRPAVVHGRDLPPGPAGGEAPHADLALCLSTSGSTGNPKLVRLSGTAVAHNARAIARALGLGPGEVAPTSLPLHYSYGLSVLNSHLACGATVLLTDEGIVGDGFWRACRAHGATSFAGVPYSYTVLRRLGLDRVAPPTLTTLTQAGGALDVALVRQLDAAMKARGGRLVVMYGQTEACARIAILPPAELPARAGAVGRALDGGALRVADDGEVIYRGPNVMMGYALTRADLARGDELGGELATGDLGRLDEDGILWITGRRKRIGKVFGVRVDLDELEAVARAQPAVVGAAVVAAGDRVKVAVEGGDPAAVQGALAAHTGLHPTGFAVAVTAALPRLASGKLDYPALEGS